MFDISFQQSDVLFYGILFIEAQASFQTIMRLDF